MAARKRVARWSWVNEGADLAAQGEYAAAITRLNTWAGIAILLICPGYYVVYRLTQGTGILFVLGSVLIFGFAIGVLLLQLYSLSALRRSYQKTYMNKLNELAHIATRMMIDEKRARMEDRLREENADNQSLMTPR